MRLLHLALRLAVCSSVIALCLPVTALAADYIASNPTPQILAAFALWLAAYATLVYAAYYGSAWLTPGRPRLTPQGAVAVLMPAGMYAVLAAAAALDYARAPERAAELLALLEAYAAAMIVAGIGFYEWSKTWREVRLKPLAAALMPVAAYAALFAAAFSWLTPENAAGVSALLFAAGVATPIAAYAAYERAKAREEAERASQADSCG